MPYMLGLAWVGSSGSGRLHPCDMPADDEVWPDSRDRLTELACIAWVEDVAREVYGGRNQSGIGLRSVEVSFLGDSAQVDVVLSIPDSAGWRSEISVDAPTLAEACIAAVRAMKGGE